MDSLGLDAASTYDKYKTLCGSPHPDSRDDRRLADVWNTPAPDWLNGAIPRLLNLRDAEVGPSQQPCSEAALISIFVAIT